MAATVVSTGGDAALTVADASSTATGHLVNGTFSLPSALQAKASSAGGTGGGAYANVGGSAAPTPLLSYAGPISNDAVTVSLQQHIGADGRPAYGHLQQDADVHAVDDDSVSSHCSRSTSACSGSNRFVRWRSTSGLTSTAPSFGLKSGARGVLYRFMG